MCLTMEKDYMTESEMYEKEIQQLNKQLYTAYGKLAALSMVEDSWQETKTDCKQRFIFESPDRGETVYRRPFGSGFDQKELYSITQNGHVFVRKDLLRRDDDETGTD